MTQDNSDAHGGYDIFRDALHLSGNPTTPPAILDQVARGSVQAPNPGARVRRAKATWTVWNVANNPSTAPATLQWIADTCPSDSIVTDVLKHPDTPREVLDRFAGKRKRFYHAYLARNTGAGDEFLRALLDAHPRDSEVVSRIMANPSISDELFDHAVHIGGRAFRTLSAKHAAERRVRSAEIILDPTGVVVQGPWPRQVSQGDEI